MRWREVGAMPAIRPGLLRCLTMRNTEVSLFPLFITNLFTMYAMLNPHSFVNVYIIGFTTMILSLILIVYTISNTSVK